MKRSTLAAVCTALALLDLSSGSRPEQARVRAARFESAHWICSRRFEGGTHGRRPDTHFEVWLEGDRALIRGTVGGGDRVSVLRLGKETYSWRAGDPKGLKWEGLVSDERELVVPSVDFVFRSADCRSRGRKYNSGTFDGHPFVGSQCQDETDGSRRIVSFASDLQDFPVHVSIAYPDRTIVTYDARSAEVPASFSRSLLELPSGVRFDPFALGKPRS